jgi:alpha-soluble NSF attachment protein
MQQAEKKLKSIFPSRNDAAMELFEKAAAQFKVAKQWDEAGEAYLRAATCAEKMGLEYEVIASYTNAAKAYKNSDATKAVANFRKAAELQMTSGKFQQAGKVLMELAGIEEKQAHVKNALKAYTEAADCFLADGSVPSENQALLKVAELSAGEGDYLGAIKIYEKVSAAALESTLLKFSVKDYFFKAALCQMAACAKNGDMKALEAKLESYKDQYPAFDGDRSCKLLESCMKAFEDDDIEAFTGHVFSYDKMIKFDNWTAALLLVVKKVIKNGGRAEPELERHPRRPDEPELERDDGLAEFDIESLA